MRIVVSLLMTLASSSALAAGERFVCTAYDRATAALGQRTVVLTQTGGTTLSDGETARFEAEIFDGAETYTEVVHAGEASVEDVAFSFRSDDGSVAFGLYLDEMNEASLTLGGQDAGDFVCHRATFVCAEYDRATQKLLDRIVTLQQTSGDGLTEGEALGFDLAVYDGASTYTETTFAGVAEVEDVNFSFAAGADASFSLYLDEAAESSLTLGGQDAGEYVCR